MNKFEGSLSIGKVAEEKVKTFYEQKGWNITDLSDVKEYRKKDIDIFIEKDDKQFFVEIKSDSKIKKNGNLFFEWEHDRVTGKTNGWFKYCEADYLAFVCEDTIYFFNMKYKDKVKSLGKHIRFQNWTDNCVSYAYVLNLELAISKGYAFTRKYEII